MLEVTATSKHLKHNSNKTFKSFSVIDDITKRGYSKRSQNKDNTWKVNMDQFMKDSWSQSLHFKNLRELFLSKILFS